eukprot:Colp12_sorted_trinity150504_noHs@27220
MVKIIVFGASGNVGHNFVKYAIEAGHEVTTFVRNPAKAIEFPESESLHIVKGDVTNRDRVMAAIKGHDVVVSAVGARLEDRKNPDLPITIMSIAIRNIIAGMNEHGVKRVIAIASAGILQENEQKLRWENAAFPLGLKNVTSDHKRVWEALNVSGLDFTIVCPANMPRGFRTGKYRVLNDYLPAQGATISCEDVADFILREITENEFVEDRVGI